MYIFDVDFGTKFCTAKCPLLLLQKHCLNKYNIPPVCQIKYGTGIGLNFKLTEVDY